MPNSKSKRNPRIEDWDGISVSGTPRRVTQLFLENGRLTAEIPATLGNLSNLEDLNLVSNQLTGEIPPELGSLSNLERLSLASNQLTGEMPATLGSLSNLQSLYLSNNQLTGEIPPELGELSNLEFLYLSNNQLTGEIPPELGEFSNLERLSLTSNQLTGCIPGKLQYVVDNDFAFLGLPFCEEASPTASVIAGKAAPDFELYFNSNRASESGLPRRLSDLRGTPVVLHFWSHGCDACMDDMYAINQVHESGRWPGIQFFGVETIDHLDPEKSQELAKERGFSYDLVYDADGAVTRDYEITIVPVTLVLDGDHNIVVRWEGGLGGPTSLEEMLRSIVPADR